MRKKMPFHVSIFMSHATRLTVFAYYIYFRVAAQQETVMEHRIRAMQAALFQTTGVRGSLRKKRDEPLLWMEIYEHVENAENFENALAAAVEKFKLAECLQTNTTRKIECFN